MESFTTWSGSQTTPAVSVTVKGNVFSEGNSYHTNSYEKTKQNTELWIWGSILVLYTLHYTVTDCLDVLRGKSLTATGSSDFAIVSGTLKPTFCPLLGPASHCTSQSKQQQCHKDKPSCSQPSWRFWWTQEVTTQHGPAHGLCYAAHLLVTNPENVILIQPPMRIIGRTLVTFPFIISVSMVGSVIKGFNIM